MFGLTIEKLFVIALIAAIIIGPQRLPHYAEKLAVFVRAMRGFADTAKQRVAEELGPDFDRNEWKKLDPRQFDPRRIVQDALADDDAPMSADAATRQPDSVTEPAPAGAPAGAPASVPAPTRAPAPATGGWQTALLSRVATHPDEQPALRAELALTTSGEG